MSKKELEKILDELINLPNETEYIEFKEAKNEFSFEKLGEYFSALSNEANLKKQKYAWLIFGITDKVPRKVSGTNYREGIKLQKLKEEIAQHTTNKITFDEIFELEKDNKRVVMFRILPSPKNIPIAFKGHYYGRDNEALGALNISEIEQIRKEGIEIDWSKQICIGATIADLEPEAIKKAKENENLKNVIFCNISFGDANSMVKELENLNTTSENIIFSQVVPSYTNTSIPVINEYQNLMKKYYPKEELGFISLEAFLSSKILVNAISRINGEITREKLILTLKTTPNNLLEGIPLEYKNSQLLNKTFLFEYKNNEFIEIKR